MNSRLLKISAMSAAGLLSLATVGCVDHPFYQDPPELRAVTVPLPPPTYQRGATIYMDFEGTITRGLTPEGTKVYVWESELERGYFTFPDKDTGDYLFEEVPVVVGVSCLGNYYVDGADGGRTASNFFAVELKEGEDACSAETCSAPDDDGNCVCIEKWTKGC